MFMFSLKNLAVKGWNIDVIVTIAVIILDIMDAWHLVPFEFKMDFKQISSVKI